MKDPEYSNDNVVKLLRSPSSQTVTVEIDFVGVELVPGVNLSQLQIVIAEEGIILGGRLELWDKSPTDKPFLSVSPESLVAPE